MAKYNISWSLEAEYDLNDILEFYIKRNTNATYSKKLYSRIKKDILALSNNPKLGLSSGIDSTRVLITGDYQIVYEIIDKKIVISMIWDSRRNPEDKRIGRLRKD